MPLETARTTSIAANETALRRLTPRWDAARRQLWLGDELVKEFRTPAAAQEAVLAAFEEEGWPDSIDDPLPSNGGRLHPKDRLRDEVRRLNAHQREGRIRFRCDGTGEGILWEVG